MLTSLKLHQFRYIKPGTELVFTEHFNVLLGKNGTGKTTLLDLISMVLRSDFSALRDEAFDIEYEYAHEHGRGLVRFENKLKQPAHRPGGNGKPRQHHPHVAITLHLDRIGPDERCEIEVEGAIMRWHKNSSAWEGSEVVDVFEHPLLGMLAGTLSFVDRHALEAFAILGEFNQYGEWVYRFDESIEVFESITVGGFQPMRQRSGRAPAISMEMRFGPGIDGLPFSSAQRSVFVPRYYEPARPEPGKSSTNVELPSGSSLAEFPQLAGLKKMSVSFSVEGSQQEAGDLWWSFGHAEFLFTGPGGVVFNHNVLSYGQKRLLAFLYYLDANPKFVIADELVNGMHHDWIRACLTEIGDRQSFLTSQNPLLLDYLPLESVAQVQKSFIQCRAEVVGDATQIVWSNLATEDAEELFADYQVGIQHVGEILRARGLW